MDYTLENLEVYQIAEELSDQIWIAVAQWTSFERDTVGKQITRAADSISANIAEGYGRFYYADSKQFYFYARGSIQETKSWLLKSKRRKLIESSFVDKLINKAELLLLKLNAYIKFIANSPGHSKKPKRRLP